MKIDLVDAKEMTITPETTAELLALKAFDGAKITIEKAKPFHTNVETLKIEAAK